MLAFIVIGAKEKIKIHDFRPRFFSCSQDDSGLTHNNFGQQETTKTAKKSDIGNIAAPSVARDAFQKNLGARNCGSDGQEKKSRARESEI